MRGRKFQLKRESSPTDSDFIRSAKKPGHSSFLNASQSVVDSTYVDDEDEMLSSSSKQDDSHYESFASFLKANSFMSESDDDHGKLNDSQRNGVADSKGTKRKSCIKKRNSPGSSLSFCQEDSYIKKVPNIRLLKVSSRLSEVLVLHHPATVTLYGYVEVSVHLGSISIFGYDVLESNSVKVLSTEGVGLKQVSTVASLHKSTVETFRRKLYDLMCDNELYDLEDFLSSITPNSVVIVVEKCLFPSPLKFLDFYYPTALQIRNTDTKAKKKGKTFMVDLCNTAEESDVLDVDSEYEVLASEIKETITESEGEEYGPRIVVKGKKGYGKSTLLRYLVNNVLNMCSEVYYLDADPGQTEFTPPAVISLTKVTQPILGPPYTHQRQPLKMIFTGSINVETSPHMYIKSVESLMKLFMAKFPKQILFVNTMGWLEGLGEDCFNQVMKAVDPTILIELVPPDNSPISRMEIIPNGITHYRVLAKGPTVSYYKPSELREFALMAYFGKCLSFFEPLNHLNCFRPYTVRWDSIAIYVIGRKVAPYRLIETIHCGVVALCRVNKIYMLESENPGLPKTLVDEAMHECLGFGIVRAANEDERLLYIITPLTYEELNNVNTFIKGNVLVPNKAFLKQSAQQVPLPFSNLSTKALTQSQKTVVKRCPNKTI